MFYSNSSHRLKCCLAIFAVCSIDYSYPLYIGRRIATYMGMSGNQAAKRRNEIPNQHLFTDHDG